MGLVRIAPENGLTVDILNTHTAAWKKNKGIREIQVLVKRLSNKFLILLGFVSVGRDIGSNEYIKSWSCHSWRGPEYWPIRRECFATRHGKCQERIPEKRKFMIRLRFVSLHILSNPSNFLFDFHGQNWLNKEYATWGNIKNYYTEPSSRPKHLDYVFYRKESDRVQTSSFSVSNGERKV